MTRNITYLLLIIGVLNSCVNPKKEKEKQVSQTIKNQTNKVILSSEIIWEKLNPARGDASPQAGTIWETEKEQ